MQGSLVRTRSTAGLVSFGHFTSSYPQPLTRSLLELLHTPPRQNLSPVARRSFLPKLCQSLYDLTEKNRDAFGQGTNGPLVPPLNKHA